MTKKIEVINFVVKVLAFCSFISCIPVINIKAIVIKKKGLEKYQKESAAGEQEEHEHSISGVFEKIKQTGLDVSKAIADRFKDTKVTRAVDYHLQLAGLETYKQILKGSQATALASMEAAKESALASLKLAKGFLKTVVQNAALGALEGPAQAAKGVLTAAQATSVGVVGAASFIVDQTVGQFDITCIHYHGDVHSVAKLNLGNVEIHAKVIKPFTVITDLNLAHPLDSASNIAKAIANEIKDIVLLPFNALKKDAPQIDQKLTQVNQLQVPKDLKQAQEEAQKNISKLASFDQIHKELQANVQQKVNAQSIENETKASYEELLKKIQALPEHDPKREALEAELKRLTNK